MSLPLWGVLSGACMSVLAGLLLPGGAGVALLVLPLALVLCPVGALAGWVIDRLRAR